MAGKKKDIKVEVHVTPVKGEAWNKTVTLKPKALTVGDALTAAGLKPDKVDVTMNGKPAQLDAALAGFAKLVVTERPQNS